ncbi:MAG: hypothetical protein ACI31B_01885 [Muribaculaceae bacterium]
MSVVGNDNPKVGDIVDVSINVKNNGDKEVNSYFTVMFYEMAIFGGRGYFEVSRVSAIFVAHIMW